MSCKKTNLFELNFVPQIDESSAFTSCASFKSVLCLLALRTKQCFLLVHTLDSSKQDRYKE